MNGRRTHNGLLIYQSRSNRSSNLCGSVSLGGSLPVPPLVLGFGQLDPTQQQRELFVTLLAQTHSPLPSKTRTFNRLRWALQNKNRCPLRGSHANRSRTNPYSPSNPLPHVGDPGGQIDPCCSTQSKHGLYPLQHTHQALERTRIKIRTHLDPAPARQYYCQPRSRVVCVGDFFAANSTFTNSPAKEVGPRLLFQRRFFRWRSRVLKLKPRLWQNSLRRIPLLTNWATNC